MGLDAGFKTRDGKNLMDFRKFFELDDLIQYDCSLLDEELEFIRKSQQDWNDQIINHYKEQKVDLPEGDSLKFYGDTDDFHEHNKTWHHYYVITPAFLAKMADKLRPAYNVLAKFSDRVVSELEEGGNPPEVSLDDMSTLQDALYNAGLQEGGSSFFFSKIQQLYIFAQFYVNSTLNKEDLIYWRSY